MSHRKMNLDRPNPNSEQIRSKQNFEQVLSKYHLLKTPVWKSPWFWGPTGLASLGIAIALSINYSNSQNNSHDKTNTLVNNSELPKDTECIHAPIAGEDIPFQQTTVDPLKDATITLASGTVIDIPKGSLLPGETGQPVQIAVREFPDKASAWLAGIPMDYGNDAAFESAGMIEIRGTQNGKIVAVNPEKPIAVSMNLLQSPAGFDFWYLNESDKSWKKHPVSMHSAPAVKPTAPASDVTAKTKKSIQEKTQQIASCEQQISALAKEKPQATTYKVPVAGHQKFDLDFDKKMYPELAKFESLIFEIIPTSGYDRSFTKKSWSDARLEKANGTYEMVLKSDQETLRLPVRPVLSGKDLKTAEAAFETAILSHNETLERIQREKKELESSRQQQQQLLNEQLRQLNGNAVPVRTPAAEAQKNVEAYVQTANFQVTKWGVFNADKPITYPEAFKQEPVLTWHNNHAADFQTLYVFNLDKNTRYAYGQGTYHALNQLGVHLNDEFVILGIDREGELGFCELNQQTTRSAFQKIVFSKKDKGTSTLDLLKKLMDENMDA
jgi:hypothetical protein